MAKFCYKCGNKLHESDKFCRKCGTGVRNIVAENSTDHKQGLSGTGYISSSGNQGNVPAGNVSAAVSHGKSPMYDIAAAPTSHSSVSVDDAASSSGVPAAPLEKGIFSFDIPLDSAGIGNETVAGPVKAFFSMFSCIGKGISNIGKNPLGLIPVFITVILWAVLFICRNIGFKDNAFTGFLSWLSYGGSSADRSPMGILGSVLGKSSVLLMFVSMFTGGFRNLRTGLQRLIPNSINTNNNYTASSDIYGYDNSGTYGYGNSGSNGMGMNTAGKNCLPWMIIGLGISFMVSQFMTGSVTMDKSMAVVSALMISLQSMGKGRGWLYGMASSITSRVTVDKKQTSDEGALRGLMTGFSSGFFLMLLFSGFNSFSSGFFRDIPAIGSVINAFPLIYGIIFIIAGLIMNHGTGKKVRNLILIMFLMLGSMTFKSTITYAAQGMSFTLRFDDGKRQTGEIDYPTTINDGANQSYGIYIAFTEAGEIPVTFDGEKYRFTIPEYSIEDRMSENYGYRFSLTEANFVADEITHYHNSWGDTGTGCYVKFKLEKPFHYDYDLIPLKEELKWNTCIVNSDINEFEIILYSETLPLENNHVKAGIDSKGIRHHIRWDEEETKEFRGSNTATFTNGAYITGFDFSLLDQNKEKKEIESTEAKETEETKKEEKEKKNVVVDSDASKNPGEQDGGAVENEIVEGTDTAKDAVGTVGGIAVGTAAVLIAAGSGGDTGSDRKKHYRMKIYKEFGDSIPPDEERFVYAAIVESVNNGPERVNLGLTSQIRIFCPDETFDVREAPGLSGDYKGAAVNVSQYISANISEGIISFMFSGAGGTYTNQMKFRIAQKRIIFYQENLALPAGYEDHAELPFTLEGFDPEKVDVRLETSEYSSYEAELVPSENAPGTYFAMITDVDKSRQDAGSVTESNLYVNVTDLVTGKVYTEGIPLLRVNEGLNFSLPALNCYRTPLESAIGKRVEQLTKNDFVPATSTARVILVLFNEEEHKIEQLPVMPEFKLEPIEEEPVVKQRVEELGIEAKLTKVEKGYAEMTFFCTKAYLEPPCRFRIKVTASCTFEGKTYKCEKEVLMRSQPVRLHQSQAEESLSASDDKEVERKLDMMLRIIARNNWEDELAGEMLIARLLLDYYDWNYGYDALLVYQVMDNFYRVLEEKNRKYRIEQAAALREADYERDDIYHELEYRTRFLDGWGGIIARIGLAIGTGGWSEAAFLAMDVNNAVVRYNDATPKEYRTTWDQVKAGAFPILIWGAFAGGGKLAGKIIPKAAAWTSNKIANSKIINHPRVKSLVQKVSSYFKESAENVKNCKPEELMKRGKNATAAMNASSKEGEAAAKAMLKGMKNELNTMEKLMEAAEKAGNKEASAFLKELREVVAGKAAMPENVLKKNIVRFCQDKYAIEQIIKENPGQADVFRAFITNCKETMLYKPIRDGSKKYIADMLGCDVNRIHIKSVSSKTVAQLRSGEAFAHDLDVTFFYKSKSGKLIELPQEIAEDALYRISCKEAGIPFKNLAEARAGAAKLQIHACQPKDAERLPEVEKLLLTKYRTAALESESVPKFVNAETYKSVTPYKTGISQFNKVAPNAETQLKLLGELENYQKFGGTLSNEAKAIVDATGNLKEAYRSFGKGCELLKNKDIGAKIVGGQTGLDKTFHLNNGIAKEVMNGNAYVAEAERLMRSLGGFESAATRSFSQMDAVNNILINGSIPGINYAAVGGAVGSSTGK